MRRSLRPTLTSTPTLRSAIDTTVETDAPSVDAAPRAQAVHDDAEEPAALGDLSALDIDVDVAAELRVAAERALAAVRAARASRDVVRTATIAESDDELFDDVAELAAPVAPVDERVQELEQLDAQIVVRERELALLRERRDALRAALQQQQQQQPSDSPRHKEQP